MDQGNITRIWLPLGLGLYALYFVFVRGPGPRDPERWLGLALCLIGLAGVILARYTLGRSFSIVARATELVTTGIYYRVRNPIYMSSVIFIVGLIVIVRRPALPLILVLIIPVQILRARREARVLEAKFGDAYRQYRERTLVLTGRLEHESFNPGATRVSFPISLVCGRTTSQHAQRTYSFAAVCFCRSRRWRHRSRRGPCSSPSCVHSDARR